MITKENFPDSYQKEKRKILRVFGLFLICKSSERLKGESMMIRRDLLLRKNLAA